MNFEHLHTHSHFSLLDGLSPIRTLVERAFELDRTSVTITDHGTMAGIPELFATAKDYGIKAIAGMEAYFAAEDYAEGWKPEVYHLTLLAMNLEGYRNLCRIVTESHRQFYRKPLVTFATLEKYNAGIICLSGCLASVIAQSIVSGDHEYARSVADYFKQIFPGRFFLEFMDHGIDSQKAVINTYTRWMAKDGHKGVATQDSHYTFEEEASVHQTLLCIGTRSPVSAPSFAFNGGPYHYCDAEHLARKFDGKLISATRTVADMCGTYDIPKTGKMPTLPEATLGGKSPQQFLEDLAWAGLKKRGIKKGTYVQRLREELTVVHQLRYEAYFIMVQDLLQWARSKGILVGPGRGSSAGSLLAYCLQITDIDPIRYGLVFERFLNKDRISPPDIDVDVADSGRQRVLQYLREKYGEERVAHIGSLSALGPRLAIRDVAIAHGVPQEQVNHVLKSVPDDPMLKFDDAIRVSEVRRGLPAKVLTEAEVMAGKPRNTTTHAAGIIIANHDLIDELPLGLNKDGHLQTIYNMRDLEKMGYIKFDVLGLKTLGIIEKVIKSAHLGKKELEAMHDFEDERVYQLLCDGNTLGVFQLESWGCTQMVRRYRPRQFEDIMMINALYRPGPMQGGEGLEVILRRRNNQEPIEYKHQSLEPILSSTYGLPVFQEQVMWMCRTLAGFTLPEADLMRSAIGKKDEVKMASYRVRFINGCRANRHDQAFAEDLWEDITFFNRYGWNRAHAAAYGAVTYYTAWLKTYYPHHYFAELINAEDVKERRNKMIANARSMGIEFMKVDINQSDALYRVMHTIRGPALLQGFANIDGIGEKAAQVLIDARYTQGGKFGSKKEARKCIPRKVNVRMFAALEAAGAFDSLPEEEIAEEVPF